MAWDELVIRGVRVVVGDVPADEWSGALKRIAAAYEDRFQRKPTVAEILASFESVLVAGESMLEDGGSLRGCRLELVNATFVDPPIDAGAYEAAYIDAKKGSYYSVERRADSTEMVRVRRLELIERTLEIDYEVIAEDDDAIAQSDARRLVRIALLDVFLDRTYSGEADAIRWRDLGTGVIEVTDYARRT